MSADFEFLLTLDKPRTFRVNAAARLRFREIAGFEIDTISEEMAGRPVVEKLGACATLIHATGIELDPGLTLERAGQLLAALMIEARTHELIKALPLDRIAAGRN